MVWEGACECLHVMASLSFISQALRAGTPHPNKGRPLDPRFLIDKRTFHRHYLAREQPCSLSKNACQISPRIGRYKRCACLQPFTAASLRVEPISSASVREHQVSMRI